MLRNDIQSYSDRNDKTVTDMINTSTVTEMINNMTPPGKQKEEEETCRWRKTLILEKQMFACGC